MKSFESTQRPVNGATRKAAVLSASLLTIAALAACSSSNNSSPFGPGVTPTPTPGVTPTPTPTPTPGPVIPPPPVGQAAFGYAARNGTELIKFNLSSPADVTSIVETLAFLDTDETIVGLDFRPANGDLHAVTSSGRMFIVDPETGLGTQIQSVIGPGTAFTANRYGVDFNPAANALRIISDEGLNLRVPTTALVSPAPAEPVNTFVDGRMGVVQGVTAAAYTNPLQSSGFTTGSTQLFVIDSTGQLYLQDANDGTLTAVGSGLADGVTAANAYAIAEVGDGNEHYAILSVGSAVGLYVIDPGFGTADLIDELEAGDYFALVVDDDLEGADTRFVGMLRRTANGSELLGFALDAANLTLELEETLPVTGLNDGDVLMSVDDRATARNGAFDGGYGLGSSGQIYTLEDNDEDAPTGIVATPFAQLSVDLDGTTFAADFNPVADLLRIVSDTGQNLRVNLEADRSIACRDGVAAARAPGFACVDGRTRVGGENVQIVATAYRAANPGGGNFQYAINAADASLYRVTVPNDGALVLVGAIGEGFGFGANAQSLDIISNDGAEGGVMALRGADSVRSALFGVDLATGLGEQIGFIGDEGAVTAITVRFEEIPEPTPTPTPAPALIVAEEVAG